MARALKCDNCGKYFGYKSFKGTCRVQTIDANTIAFCVSDENGLTHIRNYDICPDCLKKLFTIMPGFIGGEEE